ncbi:CoA pyrophosphatase [Marinilongibacter aquaticus]|uniref:NUDIX hydrolase n=1 Tax=Marinilongibacter aquaticus TaxID=2975157 RepID=UPI0021BD1881|nr:CoA pyrophosphatase [Marinilongibacter aquaticus]UBM58203.1 CoA pyrophosphatase [Marinilongibacter aquaticus]
MNTFYQTNEILKQRLSAGPPGHQNFYTHIRKTEIIRKPEELSNSRKSAVLLMLYPDKNEIYLPFILRPPYDGTHGGQISFPGGRMEEVDESFERTALREAEEEIGIKSLDVTILGELSPVYIPPSNFLVKPFVGYMNYRPVFYPDEREVAEVIEVPLSQLKHEKLEKRVIDVRGNRLVAFGFEANGNWIWGATALMVWELMEMLEK